MVLSAWGQARFRDCFLFRSKGKGRSPVSHHRPLGERPTACKFLSRPLPCFRFVVLGIGKARHRAHTRNHTSPRVHFNKAKARASPHLCRASLLGGIEFCLFNPRPGTTISYLVKFYSFIRPEYLEYVWDGSTWIDLHAGRCAITHVISPTCCALVCLVSKSHAVRCPRRNTVRVSLSAPLEGERAPALLQSSACRPTQAPGGGIVPHHGTNPSNQRRPPAPLRSGTSYCLAGRLDRWCQQSRPQHDVHASAAWVGKPRNTARRKRAINLPTFGLQSLRITGAAPVQPGRCTLLTKSEG